MIEHNLYIYIYIYRKKKKIRKYVIHNLLGDKQIALITVQNKTEYRYGFFI